MLGSRHQFLLAPEGHQYIWHPRKVEKMGCEAVLHFGPPRPHFFDKKKTVQYSKVLPCCSTPLWKLEVSRPIVAKNRFWGPQWGPPRNLVLISKVASCGAYYIWCVSIWYLRKFFFGEFSATFCTKCGTVSRQCLYGIFTYDSNWKVLTTFVQISLKYHQRTLLAIKIEYSRVTLFRTFDECC